jgi:hypothetical protein
MKLTEAAPEKEVTVIFFIIIGISKHIIFNCFSGYEPVKLMQLVTSKINNVCLDHIDNRKFENLCTELSFNHRVLHPVSVDAVRNGRRKMEDRHVVIQDLNRICSLKVI